MSNDVLKPATEEDVAQKRAIFFVPDARSRVFDVGVPLPAKAKVKTEIDFGGKGKKLAKGKIIEVCQAEIVDDEYVLAGFFSDGESGICMLDQIELLE